MVATLEQIKAFLQDPGNLVIIGASSNTSKAGYYVPKYLQSIGFKIIPINPKLEDFLGEPCYNSLEEVKNMDLKGIIIYRKQMDAEKEALRAIEMGLPMIWLPDRIVSTEAERRAQEKGLLFVHDDCALRRGRKLL